MKNTFCSTLVLALAVPWPAARAEVPAPGDPFAGYAALLAQVPASPDRAPALTLDEVERTALAVSPEIEVAARRLAAIQAHVPIAGALDDPTVMYRGWAVPLEKPWDYNQAQNMFSISQTFQGAGKRALRTNMAELDVAQAKAELEQVRLEVRVKAHKAFDDLLRAQDELRIHDEHVGIAQQAIAAARIQYTVGKVPQQDLLKAQVALTRLTEHMIRFEQDADLARAELNTLLRRDPSSPLTVQGEYAVLASLPALQQLEATAVQARPDLAALRDAAERSRKEQALAKKAYTPDFTLSGGYMLMAPGSNYRNNYMVEGSLNLPWLNRKRHDAEIAESTARATTQDAELDALRNAAFGQIQQALVQAKAAQRTAHLYHDELRPQAEATLESSVVAYENGKTEFLDLLDSQMTLIDIDLNWLQAVADFDARVADLELATGSGLNDQGTQTTEVKP
ncbi:MAG: TolC family protein [Terracidiphilus sp.]